MPEKTFIFDFPRSDVKIYSAKLISLDRGSRILICKCTNSIWDFRKVSYRRLSVCVSAGSLTFFQWGEPAF